jgi:hypothetical protein
MDEISTRDERFDSLIGRAIAKQFAFADSVPDPHWTWTFRQKDGLFLVDMPNTGVFEAQILGSESYKTNTWLMSFANKSVADAAIRASFAFTDHFNEREDDILSAAELPLSSLNGDYAAVIGTQLLGASTYVALPNDDESGLFFFLLFDVPLMNFEPTPLVRILDVLDSISDSDQVQNKVLAYRQYLLGEGFSSVREISQKAMDDAMDFHTWQKLMNSPNHTQREFNIYVDDEGRKIIWDTGHDKDDPEMTIHSFDAEVKPEDHPLVPNYDPADQLSWCLRAPMSRVAPDFGASLVTR